MLPFQIDSWPTFFAALENTKSRRSPTGPARSLYLIPDYRTPIPTKSNNFPLGQFKPRGRFTERPNPVHAYFAPSRSDRIICRNCCGDGTGVHSCPIVWITIPFIVPGIAGDHPAIIRI